MKRLTQEERLRIRRKRDEMMRKDLEHRLKSWRHLDRRMTLIDQEIEAGKK